MNQKVKVGIIGFGRMGGFYLEEMRKSDQWEVLYICDTDPEARDLARRKSPTSRIVADEQVVFEDPEVQVVGLFTLADSRLRQIKKAMAFGKHVISEKPVADTIEHEWEVVKCVENSSLFSTVNLYLRNSWYHNTIKEFIRRGEIGDLAIIRICHMTPGWLRVKVMNMKVRLFMIAECIMWTFPGGMPDASIRHGMRRRSGCGIIPNLGGCNVTGHLRTGWYLI